MGLTNEMKIIKISNGVNKTEEKYIEIMRKKSGQERLQIAIELRKLVLKLAELQIRNQNPRISIKRLRKSLFKRIYGFSFPSQISHR